MTLMFGNEMANAQRSEWAKAQEIVITQDLVAAAKRQLVFLAAVDRNRALYEGPFLDNAIYRYKYFWLPLLAKHVDFELSEAPFVVPLDCEWIWHCHRLNPIRYKKDCFNLFGKILGCDNVVSSVAGASGKESEALWNQMYPEEPYEVDMTESVVVHDLVSDSCTTDYDLVSASQRQSTFFYQVSRAHMKDDTYLKGAVARYKAFLHLIKTNKHANTNSFCVPLYDIDLIWHSHQLNPLAYSSDLVRALGGLLDHDDTDSDRTKGEKLDVGFSGTMRQWEDLFGLRYRRAGALYRGNAPRPLEGVERTGKVIGGRVGENCDVVKMRRNVVVEVMLEIVEVKNSPSVDSRNLFLSFNKKQPDVHFTTRKTLNLNIAEDNQVAAFQCEPVGELEFKLMSDSDKDKCSKLLGTASVNLQDLLNPVYYLYVEKWVDFGPVYGLVAGSELVSVRIAFSLTNPVPAPYVLRMVPSNRFLRPVQDGESWTSVVDEVGEEVMTIQMRQNSVAKKEVIGMTPSGDERVVAELLKTGWSLLLNSPLHLQKKSNNRNEHVFELKGSTKKVMIFGGRKLDYERKCCERQESEVNFMTVVEFCEEQPYGKAVALYDLCSGRIEINEDCMLMPLILCGFILSKENTNQTSNNANQNQTTLSKLTTLKNLISNVNSFPHTHLSQCTLSSPCHVSDTSHGGCGCDRRSDTSHANCNGGSSDAGHAHCGGCKGGCSGACGGRCGGGGGRCGGGSCSWGNA